MSSYREVVLKHPVTALPVATDFEIVERVEPKARAGLYPDRTAAVALEGLPAWTEPERQDFTANYLPTFTPKWDGSHMAWLWAMPTGHLIRRRSTSASTNGCRGWAPRR